ncbi:the ARF-like 2 binding protein BART-domain-containing protein [Blastocladiella britannica]|nr:the ARF-like 2 binding protein BART-domain-containing protein [Blastocladiella britannica]
MSLARQASSKSSITDVALPTAESSETIQSTHDAQALRFDQVIGEIESILVDPEFVEIQDAFFEKHYLEFENKDENKLECMQIFRQYTQLIERQLESRLLAAFEWFEMADFMRLCRNYVRNDEKCSGDVFDVLASLGDFNLFKEIILAYREQREGTAIDFSDLLRTNPVH